MNDCLESALLGMSSDVEAFMALGKLLVSKRGFAVLR